MSDAYRALTYWLEDATDRNAQYIAQKSLATQIAAIAVVVEVVLLVAFLGV